MQLAAGTAIGNYEILSAIGKGGMGEVYRARDTKLKRHVAIKSLPAEFAGDADRLARFQREAEALAALNHPHIGAIYGLEESGGTRFLVLELIEGETLAQQIERGPIPIEVALRLAREIAEALEAAHEKGIIHRDLKPANIKVTPDGAVKVLDFGLAKMTADEAPAPDLSHSPTVTMEGTRTGTILGTAAYMSPEQARGKTVDARTDIWSLGCTLYEMLSGKNAFSKETLTDTIAAIVGRDPDWSVLLHDTPDSIRSLLRRCLAKDVHRRLHHMADVRIEIEDAILAPVSTKTSLVTDSNSQSRRPWRNLALVSVGVLIVGAAASLILRNRFDKPAAFIPISTPIRLTWDVGLTTEPSISADGHLIAYASDRSGEGNLDIYVQQTAGGSPIRLTSDPTDDREPSVSPDGSLIVFRSERNGGGIYIIPALGGDARLIASEGRTPKFSPDGQQIAFWKGNWLALRAVGSLSGRKTYVVSAKGGGEVVPIAPELNSSGDPVWSPDGKALLVLGRRGNTGADAKMDWWWVPLDGRPPIPTGSYERLAAAGVETAFMADIPDIPFPEAWTTDGVFFHAFAGQSNISNIWTIPISLETGRATGDPKSVTMGLSASKFPAVARDGRLVFASLVDRSVLFGLPIDANAGRTIGSLKRLRNDDTPTARSGISGDGRLLVFPAYLFSGSEVWIKDLTTGRERQIAAAPPAMLNPVISRDGRWVAYTVTTRGTGAGSGPGIGYIISADGGAPRKVCDNCQLVSWSSDDRRVVVQDGSEFVNLLDVDTGNRVPLIPASGRVDVSPNERWVTFINRGKIFLAPVRPGHPPSESE